MSFKFFLCYLRWLRDKKYLFTKCIFKTNFGFKLWAHKKPKSRSVVSKIEREIVITFINKVDYFIDIGAFIGFFSIFAKKKNKLINVCAFEPHKQNFKLLKKNFELNNLQTKNIYNVALSNKNYVGKIFGFGQGASLVKNWGNISNYHDKINVAKLDDYYENFKNAKKGVFIKIDAEGNELNILKGCRKILKLNVPIYILYENSIIKNYFPKKNENFMLVHKFLINNKFKIFRIDNLEKQIKLHELKKIYDNNDDFQINYLGLRLRNRNTL